MVAMVSWCRLGGLQQPVELQKILVKWSNKLQQVCPQIFIYFSQHGSIVFCHSLSTSIKVMCLCSLKSQLQILFLNSLLLLCKRKKKIISSTSLLLLCMYDIEQMYTGQRPILLATDCWIKLYLSLSAYLVIRLCICGYTYRTSIASIGNIDNCCSGKEIWG